MNKDTITIGDITLLLASYEVSINNKLVTMRLKEYQLFRYLFIN